MKKYVRVCVLIGLMVSMTGFFFYGVAAEATKQELKPMIRVSPNELSFNCTIIERGKEVIATNASKRPMPMNARTSDSWISVSPATQPNVQSMGKAPFTVTVDCHELKGAKAWVGSVIFEGSGSTAKVIVKAKPQLEPAPRAK